LLPKQALYQAEPRSDTEETQIIAQVFLRAMTFSKTNAKEKASHKKAQATQKRISSFVILRFSVAVHSSPIST
jgi:hypothetical protein